MLLGYSIYCSRLLSLSLMSQLQQFGLSHCHIKSLWTSSFNTVLLLFYQSITVSSPNTDFFQHQAEAISARAIHYGMIVINHHRANRYLHKSIQVSTGESVQFIDQCGEMSYTLPDGTRTTEPYDCMSPSCCYSKAYKPPPTPEPKEPEPKKEEK